MKNSQATSKSIIVEYDEQGIPNSVEITPLTRNPLKETKDPDCIYNPQTGLMGYPNVALFDDDEEFTIC